ncbi:hypothetical protein [Paenibacillus xylanexedens]|nr:hypothetical protein [Paenibacillus xylanexedens]
MSSILFSLDPVLTKEMRRLFPNEEASRNWLDAGKDKNAMYISKRT